MQHHEESLLEMRSESADDAPAPPGTAAARQPQTHRHLPELDGVRGLAVFAVFLVHYGGGKSSHNVWLHGAGVAIEAGWTGVTLFFILSGFLITGILWDSRETVGALRNFYMRRVLRIFPLYYACLFLVLLGAAFTGGLTSAWTHLAVYALYLQNVPLPAWLGGAGKLQSPLELSHFWSLAVEEQFYLLWPFLILRLRRASQARWIAFAVFLGSAIFRVLAWYLLPAPGHPLGSPGYRVFYGAYGFTLSRAGELAAGALLAMFYREPALWKRCTRAAPTLCLAGLSSFLLAAWRAGSLSLECAAGFMIGLPSMTLALSGLLVLALGKGMVHRLMTLHALRWLGGISYGFYIFHVLFTRLFTWITFHIAHTDAGPAALGLNFIVAFTTSVLLASLSFRFFEMPFLRLRSRFRSAT